MTLADFVDDVAAERKTLTIYAGDDAPDVSAYFDTRNVTVEREPLPPGGPSGFAVLRDSAGFVGAFGLAELAELLEPPLFRPWYRDDVSEPWRALYTVLDDALFASFDRRQLLATAREIENRAWRVGAGTLRVGFQRVDAYRSQLDVYRRLAAETDLDIRAYVDGEAGADLPSVAGVAVVTSSAPEIGRYWFLAFDAAGDPTNACALLAEERDPGSFHGFWTYDPDRVAAISSYLQRTYDGH